MQTTFAAHSVPPEPDLPELEDASAQPLAVVKAERGKNYMHMTVAQVENAYAEKLADGRITREQLNKITWLLFVCKAEKYNLAEISEQIGYNSNTTLYRVFRGIYEAGLENILERIDTYKAVYEQRQGVGKSNFVTTSLSKQIFTLCDLARTYQVISPIYGNSQTGKSTALKEYARLNNHGQTIYISMPAGGHLFKFLIALAKAIGVSPKGNSVALTDRIRGALTENMLLIIDEIHQICLSINGGAKLNTIEFIRLELYEAVNCGVVLCGTNVFRDEMERGRNSGWLEQTRRRDGGNSLQLPPMLPREDMDAIAASYKLPPAPADIHKLRVEIIQRHGLRAYTNMMRAGGKLAFNRGEEITWSHFLSAHDALAKLSTGGAK